MSLDCKAFVTGLTRLKEVLDQALTICDYADGSELELFNVAVAVNGGIDDAADATAVS